MNIIRTKAVELNTIPAIAYKQKLPAGGAGVKIQRMDQVADAVVTLDKRSEGWAPYGKIESDLFPIAAIEEAIEAVRGLPYSARGNVKISPAELDVEEDVSEDAPADQVDMTLSPEYQTLIKYYSNERGRLNHDLMNKEMIQFAVKSSVVSSMIQQGKNRNEIVNFVVQSRINNLMNGKSNLDEAKTELLIESLDEIDPRSAFKELKAYLNRLSGKTGSRKK